MNTRRVLASSAAAVLLAAGGLAGCSNADSNGSESSPSAEAGAASLEGEKVIVLVSGDRKDQGFNQGTVDGFTEASERLGFDLVVMDMVDVGNSKESFENAARQNPALVVSGGAELFDGFSAVCENPQYDDISFWSVADFPPSCEGAVHVNADAFQAYYLTGVASGLLLDRDGGDKVGVVTGPELTFVTTQLGAMEEGLAAQNPDAEFVVNYTGAFDDAGLAREGAAAFIGQGAGLLASYMSSGKVGVIAAAEEAGVPVLANSWDGCDKPMGNDFAGSTVIDLGPSFNAMLDDHVAGELQSDSLYIFGVDSDGVGANICDATPEEQEVLDAAKEQLLAGEIEIKSGGFVQQEDGTAVPRD